MFCKGHGRLCFPKSLDDPDNHGAYTYDYVLEHAKLLVSDRLVMY